MACHRSLVEACSSCLGDLFFVAGGECFAGACEVCADGLQGVALCEDDAFGAFARARGVVPGVDGFECVEYGAGVGNDPEGLRVIVGHNFREFFFVPGCGDAVDGMFGHGGEVCGDDGASAGLGFDNGQTEAFTFGGEEEYVCGAVEVSECVFAVSVLEVCLSAAGLKVFENAVAFEQSQDRHGTFDVRVKIELSAWFVACELSKGLNILGECFSVFEFGVVADDEAKEVVGLEAEALFVVGARNVFGGWREDAGVDGERDARDGVRGSLHVAQCIDEYAFGVGGHGNVLVKVCESGAVVGFDGCAVDGAEEHGWDGEASAHACVGEVVLMKDGNVSFFFTKDGVKG